MCIEQWLKFYSVSRNGHSAPRNTHSTTQNTYSVARNRDLNSISHKIGMAVITK